jgi:dTMP kinase
MKELAREKGIFVTFEGADGSGKTSVSQGVYQSLVTAGYQVVYTREPGGSEIAEQIRNVILDLENVAMDYKTEALLYAASRRQHLVDIIWPALSNGKIVICDRFVDSSLAYQGFARGIAIDDILEINKFAIEDFFPDLTIFLEVTAEAGLARIKNRTNLDRLDQESSDFHKKVVTGYQEILKMFPERFLVFDGMKTIDELVTEITSGIIEWIDKDVSK